MQVIPLGRRAPHVAPLRGRPAVVDHHRWESGFKLDIPKVHSLGPEEFLDWIGVVEEILDFKDVLDDKRVSLVATRFRGQAAASWQPLKVSRSRSRKEKILSWRIKKNT